MQQSNSILTGKTILITGGAGFIGSNLCEYFLQKNRVVCFDNFVTGHKANIEKFLNQPNFSLVEGDIRNPSDCEKAVNGCDIVLHQAALGSVPRSIHDPATTNDVNVNGFLNMMIAARNAGIKRFVYASSSSVYGDLEELPKKEERTGNQLSPYAVSKYVNELYAKVFSTVYGIETIGLRYFNVFGKQQDPNGQYAAAIPRFIAAIKKGQSPVIYGDGEQTRDFTYIRNVIQANELAASVQHKEALNRVYNIAYGNQTTVNQLVQTIIQMMAELDPSLMNVQMNHEKERIGDVRYSQASIGLAQQLLGYQPEYDLQRGMKEAIEWYWNNL